MSIPRYPPTENFSGTVEPAFTELTTGRLSTGAKNPCHGHSPARLGFGATTVTRTVLLSWPPSPSVPVTTRSYDPAAP